MRSRALSILAISACSVLGLAACGSDSTDTTTDSTVTVGAGETVAPDTMTTDTMTTDTMTTDSMTTDSMAATTMAADMTATTMAGDMSATTMATAAGTADIVDTAMAAGNFTTLTKLLTDAGLVETLKGAGPFTVFAPTDEAFAAVPADTLAALAADKAMLTKVLTYHVVPGAMMAADIKAGDATTVEGGKVTITVSDGAVKVNDATVTMADVKASNGVIHVIDKVLMPPAS